jgi:hypothetical protein
MIDLQNIYGIIHRVSSNISNFKFKQRLFLFYE